MHLKKAFLAGLFILVPLIGYAASRTPPPAGASATEVVKFVVDYESYSTDATALLRGHTDKPTTLETLLFTHDFLTAWYALKAKEVADPEVGNVTNGDSDYIISGGPDGQQPRSIKYNDVSDSLNGTMVSLAYRTNGANSTLFFLKREDGRFKIDDITLEPFVYNNFDPKILHRPGTAVGVRKDIADALNNAATTKK